MILKPDLGRPIIDPFNSPPLNVFCDILMLLKKPTYEDPRGTAKKAEDCLKKTGIVIAFLDPKPEFCV